MANPFEIIAKVVKRHEKRLLVAWVLVVLLSIPFAIDLGNKLESSESEFVGHTESLDVENLLEAKFPSTTKATTAIILDSLDPNLTAFDPTIQNLLVDLEDTIYKENLKNVLNVTSYKTLERQIQEQYDTVMNQTQDSLRILMKGMVNDTMQNITLLRQMIVQLHNTTHLVKNATLGFNQLQQMIPALYVFTWWNMSRINYYLANLTKAYNTNEFLNSTQNVTLLENIAKVLNATDGTFYWAPSLNLILQYYTITNITVPPSSFKIGNITYQNQNTNIADSTFHSLTTDVVNQTLYSYQNVFGPDAVSLGEAFLQIYNQTWNTTFSNLITLKNSGKTLFSNYTGASDISTALQPTILPIIYVSQMKVLRFLLDVNKSMFDIAVSTMNTSLILQNQNETAALWDLAYKLGANSQNKTLLRELVLSYLSKVLIENLTAQNLPFNATEFVSLVLPQLYDIGEPLPETLTKNLTLTIIENILANVSSVFSFNDLVPSEFQSLLPGKSTENLNIEDYFNISKFLDDVYELSLNTSTTELDIELYANTTADSIILKLEENPTFRRPSISNGGIPKDLIEGFVSDDNKTTLMLISFDTTERTILEENALKLREIIKNKLANYNLTNKIKSYVTGAGALEHDLDVGFERDLSRIDIVTVALVFLLLIIVFSSVVTWAIPLIAIGSALVTALMLLWFYTTLTGEPIPSTLRAILTTIMMGAGVDYVIFTLARYQEERRRGHSKDEATIIAIENAGESVTSSGMTVIVGFGALLLSGFSFLRIMGTGPLIGISLSLIAVLTLVPAALFTFGDKLFYPRKLENTESLQANGAETSKKRKEPILRRVTRFTTKHPIIVISIFLILSAPFVYAAVFEITPDYDFTALMPSDMESVRGLKVMRDKFSEGELIPLVITMNFSQSLQNGTYYNVTAFDLVEDFVRGLERILNESNWEGTIYTVTRPNGIPIDYKNYTNVDPVNKSLMDLYISKDVDNTTVKIDVQFTRDPLSLESLKVTRKFKNYRTELQRTNSSYAPSEVTILIGGFPSTYEYLKNTLDNDTPIIIAAVLIGTFIVLFFLLGSVFSPLRLQFTIGLSVLVSLGLTQIVFVDILGKSIPWIAPIMITVVLFGLGLDYDIFIVTRMREEVSKGASDKEAIVTAIENTGKVITAAGVIMASALGSLVLAQNLMLQVIGFSFFVAILLDATLIRLFLVPAIMSLFEKWNWWAPGPFQRVKR